LSRRVSEGHGQCVCDVHCDVFDGSLRDVFDRPCDVFYEYCVILKEDFLYSFVIRHSIFIYYP